MIAADQTVTFRGNDRLLYGIILGVITFWLLAQTTLNIAPVMGRDLSLGASMMNIVVAITALFSGALRKEGAIIRLIGAVLLEANDEWQIQHRYMQTEAMAELTPPLTHALPTQISTAAA